MTFEEYQRAIKEAMYRAMYSGFRQGGFYHEQPRTVEINPEARAKAEKSVPLLEVRPVTFNQENYHVILRRMSVGGPTILCDEAGQPYYFVNQRKANAVAARCGMLISKFGF